MKRLILTILHTMKLCMCRFTRKQHQVVDRIIKFISVDMVDNFSWKKVSSKMFFHYKAMLQDVIIFWGKRMVEGFNHNIATLYNSTTFPIRAFFQRKPFFSSCASTRKRTIFHSIFSMFWNKYNLFTNYASRFFSSISMRWLPLFTNIVTFTRTILSRSSFYRGWRNIKFFVTNRTIHKSSLVIVSIIALMLCCCQEQCYGASEWDINEVAGTRNVSDIDTYMIKNNTALDRMLSNYRKGAKISYASASTITVGIGEVMCSNAGGTVRKMRKNTSATTVAWANIDTGSEANSTTYYLYAVADTDATTFTVVISANSSTPQGGQTYYKRLGSFYNDGSGNILNDETIVNDDNYYALELGDWVSKTIGTTYQATTDGFVVAFIDLPSSGGSAGGIIGYTDNAAAPTTARAKGYVTQNLEDSSITFPVKRGDYYKVSQSAGSGSTTGMYWIPSE